ncbi:hypothetical protein PYCCODRAFT_1417948 [Trametes coccinea BRFM310]|uniref:Uncharacterized protein n=1 Tax=Trametes coccinea (strain BRFM310) TaxID=1353009 RepID=A0A1Y2IEN0_TRAC3|nr:hypothetical protein PYCCODRAFT_1417948 [Trametes coccinea BRFM310]
MRALQVPCRTLLTVSTIEWRLAAQTLSCHHRRLQLLRRFHRSRPVQAESIVLEPKSPREEAKLKVPEHSPSAYVQPIIRTLRPEALSTEDHVVFSVEQGYCFVWDALAAGQSPSSSISTSLAQNNRPFANIRYSNEHTRFPAGLQGFFYYYTYKHGAPLTSGELRFRRTSINDPAAFSSGEDLKAAHGLPWRMLLPTLASSPTYETICRILRRDGLVDEETLRVAARMGSSRARRTEQISLIHSLRQPFYLDFASPIHWWHIMGPDTIYFARPMSNVLAPKLEGHRFPSPWRGSAICAFVPSKHPSHKERRILNIIVLSIVEPPTPNPAFPSYLLPDISQTPPRVGDMLRRGRSPWALDVDSCEPWRAEGFRTLFENAQLPPPRTGRLVGPLKG